jgi:uracil-DNA glycosylase family 4
LNTRKQLSGISLDEAFEKLNRRIVRCKKCPRLIDHCQIIAQLKRRSYVDENYWGKPVPNFGDPAGGMLIVGLAPGAHGANRTGRMFTGDRSGDWLYRALHRAGFANQAESTAAADGLRLLRCQITAVCHCAPPDNKPNAAEVKNCQPFLAETIKISNPRVFLALGKLAFDAVTRFTLEQEWIERPRPKFSHGKLIQLGNKKSLLGCYHPSQQNTFTGRLTETMLDEIMYNARQLCS